MSAAFPRMIIYAGIFSVCGVLSGDMKELRREHYRGAQNDPAALGRVEPVREWCTYVIRRCTRVQERCGEVCRGGAGEASVLDQMRDDVRSVHSALEALTALVDGSTNVDTLNAQLGQIRLRIGWVTDGIDTARSSMS